ncbi:Uridine kinase [Candidatus Izimaplasma bacterium HR1]|jgi:uridine kinase|uniref:AAA family ATPase n=1 Tax=Candidatus Izimoplasma sp. HR1 TaxID=1541959 RepID=UPI0004F86931|nr:Uridine kinase [Candidatus Izimaplasma bacterium HR1]
MKSLNVEQLIEHILRTQKKKPRCIVSISGKSRSGKSTLAKKLHDILQEKEMNTQIIHLEDWIIPVSERTEEMNVYDRFNYQKLINDFNNLLNEEEVHFHAYESKTRGIEKGTHSYKLIDEGVIIIDGVITLGLDVIYNASDVTVFVEIKEKVRYERIKKTYEEKGLKIDEINDLYIDRLEDEFNLVDKLKYKANTIVKTPVV